MGTIRLVQETGARTIQVEGDQYAEEVAHVARLVQGTARGEEHVGLTGRTIRTLERIASAAHLH